MLGYITAFLLAMPVRPAISALPSNPAAHPAILPVDSPALIRLMKIGSNTRGCPDSACDNWAPLNAVDQIGNNFLEARVIDAVTQVRQPFQQRHTGAGQLLQMKTEGNQFAPFNYTATRQPSMFLRAAGW